MFRESAGRSCLPTIFILLWIDGIVVFVLSDTASSVSMSFFVRSTPSTGHEDIQIQQTSTSSSSPSTSARDMDSSSPISATSAFTPTTLLLLMLPKDRRAILETALSFSLTSLFETLRRASQLAHDLGALASFLLEYR